MRKEVNRIFRIALTVFMVLSVILVVAWLFDSKPDNLYFAWSISSNLLICSTLFLILFGGNKN